MTAWLDTFIPTFGLLALGALLKRSILPDDAVWAGMEKLVFWALLPALLVGAIGGSDIMNLPLGGMAGTIWGGLLAGSIVSLLLARALGCGHPAMTSVLQGGIRYNNLMGFALGGALWGPPAIAMGGIVSAFIVPFVQVAITLAFSSGGPRPSPARMLRQLLLNPLMLACFAGFALAALGGPPPGLAPLLRTLGQASVAIGLLAVGAALSPGALGSQPLTQLLTGMVKLAIVPAITLGLALLFGLEPMALKIAVLFMALPTATTSYVMARAMGGDAPLMAALITTQHVAAIVSLPLWVLFLGFLQ
ncbi:AEC family transporter [Acetobacteraceae bacterium H6797]|nr:AEC family transporter [Acetobacteraceae bacterium H6797]